MPDPFIIRKLIREASYASLGVTREPTQNTAQTRQTAQTGQPYVSLCATASDRLGRPLFLFSTLSAHTQALEVDPRASVLITQTQLTDNPQTMARVSIMGQLTPCDDPEVRQRYLTRHAAAALYADFGDFSFYRLEPEELHYVGGFAQSFWTDARILADETESLALAADATEICEHMNEDHLDAIQLFANSSPLSGSGEKNPAIEWQMIDVDSDGMDLRQDERVIRIPFPEPVADSSAVRRSMISMLKALRAAQA